MAHYVDYIGLANRLTDALTLYAATDEMQELHDGLQDIGSELPALEEPCQRLLQLFDAQDEALKRKDGRFQLLRSVLRTGGRPAAEQAFVAWYRQKGQSRIAARVAHHAPRVAVQPRSVEVREMGFRWASCSPSGDLQFHWK